MCDSALFEYLIEPFYIDTKTWNFISKPTMQYSELSYSTSKQSRLWSDSSYRSCMILVFSVCKGVKSVSLVERVILEPMYLVFVVLLTGRNSVDQNQVRCHSVPDLDPRCLQIILWISACPLSILNIQSVGFILVSATIIYLGTLVQV